MKISRQLREQLDACRPGSGDLALPELAELAAAVKQDRAVTAELDRSQRFDAAAKAALDDLPVPTGLLGRLLAAIEANRPTPALPPAIPSSKSRWSSRRLLLAAGTAAVMLFVAITALWFVPRRPQIVANDEIGLAIADWWAADQGTPAAAWHQGNPSSARFALPGAMSVKVSDRWRSFTATRPDWSGNAVAMHLNPPGEKRAMLFVVQSSARFQVPSTPTAVTLSGFSGRRVKAMAWQIPQTKMLYILVVEDGQRLEQFLKPRIIT
jgi:hypothetical protein